MRTVPKSDVDLNYHHWFSNSNESLKIPEFSFTGTF